MFQLDKGQVDKARNPAQYISGSNKKISKSKFLDLFSLPCHTTLTDGKVPITPHVCQV